MLHENDMDNGGCEFGRFFETTPQDLIQDGLYKALALAAYPGAFWPVSVALVAQALGATGTKRKRKQGAFLPGKQPSGDRMPVGSSEDGPRERRRSFQLPGSVPLPAEVPEAADMVDC